MLLLLLRLTLVRNLVADVGHAAAQLGHALLLGRGLRETLSLLRHALGLQETVLLTAKVVLGAARGLQGIVRFAKERDSRLERQRSALGTL